MKNRYGDKQPLSIRHFYLPLVLGLLLMLPSVFTGLQMDDYYHWGLVTDNPLALPGNSPASVFGLFTFLDGNPERTQQLINQGMLPWWTLTDVKYAFWRPLTEITHGIDYWFWPQLPWLMHLHTLGYLLLLMLATYKLLQRWLKKGALNAAFWIFCLSYTHGFAAGWLANRNAVLATLFTVLTLYCHDRWRIDRIPVFLVVALLCFAAGLLSGELGVSAGLFLLAYALCMEPADSSLPTFLAWIKKLLTIALYGLVGLLWLFARSYLGYGAEKSGHYVDPGNIAEFLTILSERYLQLLGGALWSLPPEFAGLFGDLVPLLITVIGSLWFLIVVLPVLRANAPARFFGLSLLLVLIPVCATNPHSRLLITASLPLAALVGVYFSWRMDEKPLPAISQTMAPVLSFFLFVTLIIMSPLLKSVESVTMKLAMDGALNNGALNLPITAANQNKIHVVLNPPLSGAAGYIQGVRAYHQLPNATVVPLTSAVKPVVLTRLAENRINLSMTDGLYQAAQENLLRGPGYPLKQGEIVKVAGMQAQVKSLTVQGVPTSVDFEWPVHDPGYQFHLWHRGKPVVCNLPPVGTEVTLTQDRDSCAPSS
ncbi:MAG: hypothetical protein MI976_05365 [Pseudomonadales bacterium]|nr:hypothetical protein [Pseudomonadales bacterium]